LGDLFAYFSDLRCGPRAIISTLSAGPVGVGDALGGTNAQKVAAVVRRDSVIVKPDRPLLPIDSMYASDATNSRSPMITMAGSTFGDETVRYVFAYPRTTTQEAVSVPLSDLGTSGPVFAYDWRQHTGELILPGGNLRMKFVDAWDYQILSPVNRKGLALLGDTEQIVPLGKKRIAAIEDRGTLTITIEFARGENTLPISGYASRRPKVKALEARRRTWRTTRRCACFSFKCRPRKVAEPWCELPPRLDDDCNC
jgi:hypothetical protein